MDPLSLAIGAACVAVGYALGEIPGRRPKTDPAPICPCKHSIAVHDPETKQCREQERRDRWDSAGDWVGYDYVPCPCRRYLGPELLADVWSPGIALPPPDQGER
jgi:hypothetical protein